MSAVNMRCWSLIGILSALAIAYGHASPPPDDDRELIEWPSREHPTLQSAIDGLRDGGKLRIAPGEFEIGQPLLVRDRDIVIEGAGCRDLDGRDRHRSRQTRLVGPRPSRVPDMGEGIPLFAVTGSGGLVLRGLELSGFDAGVGVVDGEAAEPGRLQLTIEDACIADTVRGIASSHSAVKLIVRNVQVHDLLWNGVSFAPAKALADALFISYGLTMANPKQACVVVKNAAYTAFNTQLQNCGFNGPPGAGGGVLAVNSSVVFVDSSVNAPNGPGIAARGIFPSSIVVAISAVARRPTEAARR